MPPRAGARRPRPRSRPHPRTRRHHLRNRGGAVTHLTSLDLRLDESPCPENDAPRTHEGPAALSTVPDAASLRLRLRGYLAFLAMTCVRILEYSARVTIFLVSSSALVLNGRAAMILSAVASPTPGSFIRSSLVAELRSIGGSFVVFLLIDCVPSELGAVCVD